MSEYLRHTYVTVKQSIRRFTTDQRGAVAVFLALGIIPLIGFIGIATDAARGYMVKAKLQQALDAAALAGGRAIEDPDRDDDIRGYFAANFPDGLLGASVAIPTIVVDTAEGIVDVQVAANLPTSFMRVLGIDDITVNAQSVVHRAVRGMELVLIMDNTGSMRWDNKMVTMKNAATELIDILYGQKETIKDFYVGIVPYVSNVNVGFAHTDWTSDYDPANFDLVGAYSPTQLSWKGCVLARPYPDDTNDKTPAQALFQTYIWQDDSENNWDPGPYDESDAQQAASSNTDGPNLSCPTPILPLTAEKSTVQAAIDAMVWYRRFGTMSNVGMVWGWRVLSPAWRGLWGGATPPELPLDYNEPLTDKVAILLTDGLNQWSGASSDYYYAYGYPDDGNLVPPPVNNTNSRAELNSRLAEICSSMKAAGTIIYTITFRVGSNTEVKDLYKNCASDPSQYFDSPSNEQLSQTFQAIGAELSNLRLQQ